MRSVRLRLALTGAGIAGLLLAATVATGAVLPSGPGVMSATPLPVSAATPDLGKSIASSGDTVVVGAPWLVRGKRGELLVFERPASGDWQHTKPVAVLTVSRNLRSALLGVDVAISGTTIVAGDPERTVNGQVDAGAVYVFSEPKGGWHSETESAILTAPDSAANLALGASVSISGDTIAAGAPNRGRGGRAYTFTRGPEGWSDAHVAELSVDTNADLGPGQSVAISGDTIAAAAGWSTTSPGTVDVFKRPTNGWTTTSTPAAVLRPDKAAGYRLEGPIALSGDTLAATVEHSRYPYQSAVDVFSRPASGWHSSGPTAKLTETLSQKHNQLGASLSISGDTITAGAPDLKLDNRFVGAVFRYQRPSSGWRSETQTTAILPPANAPEQSGFGVSAASVGNDVFISAVELPTTKPALYVAAVGASAR